MNYRLFPQGISLAFFDALVDALDILDAIAWEFVEESLRHGSFGPGSPSDIASCAQNAIGYIREVVGHDRRFPQRPPLGSSHLHDLVQVHRRMIEHYSPDSPVETLLALHDISDCLRDARHLGYLP